MAAIEGFELSISSGDTAIAHGYLDGAAVAAGTIDAAADADGDYLVVWDGSAYDHVAEADVADGDTVLGTATVASAAVTAVSYAGRGMDPIASADA